MRAAYQTIRESTMTFREVKALAISISEQYSFGDNEPMDKPGMTEDQKEFWRGLENHEYLDSKYLSN